MYESFFGLRERPFDLTPNWRYLHLTPMHREALSAIQYGVSARRGIIVVVGEAGTGKTTVVRAALRGMREHRVRQAYLSNPMLTREEFLRFLERAFRLPAGSAEDKVALLSRLTSTLVRYHARNRPVVLVVDEAQSMPHALLEEIRLLANIETATSKLLQVVLVGQPELADALNDPSLRQLKQRVAIRASLRPLDLKATAAMIAGRLRVAGGSPAQVFTPAAVEAVYRHSGGVPRLVSVICDNALLSGFAADQKPVGIDLIHEVCRDFDLPAVTTTATVQSSAGSPGDPAPTGGRPASVGGTAPQFATATPVAAPAHASMSGMPAGPRPEPPTPSVASRPEPPAANSGQPGRILVPAPDTADRGRRRWSFLEWVRR
jgi:general secretion pathway protein A